MRVFALSVYFLTLSFGFAQNCSPDFIESESKSIREGEFKGEKLLSKLQDLMRELQVLSSTPIMIDEPSQKKALTHCRDKKSELFKTLWFQGIKTESDNPLFNELIGDHDAYRRNYDQALLEYDRAITNGAKDLDVRIKAFNMFVLINHINLKYILDKKLFEKERLKMYQELSNRAQLISEHPEALKPHVIEMLTHQAIVADFSDNKLKSMELYEKILTVDPKNELAARHRFEYFVSKQQVNEALTEFRRLERNGFANSGDWVAVLEVLTSAKRFEDAINWAKKVPHEDSGKNPEITALLARSYLMMGRFKEASLATKSLPKNLSEKAEKIASQNKSILLERDADQLKKANRLSEALDAYKTALKNSPNPLAVQEKISVLIYDYRKGLNFKPVEATQADLKEVVQLLQKSAEETELKPNVFEIYLHSLKLTRNTALLGRACDRFRELYPDQVSNKTFQASCNR